MTQRPIRGTQQLHRAPVQPRSIKQNLTLPGLRSEDTKKLSSFFKQIPKPITPNHSEFLVALSNCKDQATMYAWFLEFIQNASNRNSDSTITAEATPLQLLDVYIQEFKKYSCSQNMHNKQLNPNKTPDDMLKITTFQITRQACNIYDALLMCKYLLDTLKIPLNAFVCNAVINKCAVKIKLLNYAPSRKFGKIDTETESNPPDDYCKIIFEFITKWIKMMQDNNITPNPTTYITALAAAANAFQFPTCTKIAALDFLDNLLNIIKTGNNVTQNTYNISNNSNQQSSKLQPPAPIDFF